MEDELKITQEELQGTIEQLESSNEELKASNEEAIASNEEMQSANEELETSKEELQSLNEELNTVNARLHEKVEELENTNNDVVNLLGSTNIATIFLDRDFKVMRYTPAITLLLSLIPSDVGRPIVDITRKFRDEALLSDARRVLADLAPAAKEVRAEDGRWYIRRITPYRTHDDRIEGVVVTFLDVHDLKQSEQERERLASFPLLNPQPIIEADLEGNVHFLNPSAQRLIPDLEQRGIEHPWLADWGTVVRTCQEDGADLITREVIVGERYYQQTIHYVSEIGRIRIYGTEITNRKQVEETLQESEERYHALFDKMSEGFALHEIICDQSGKPMDYRFLDINSAFERLTGLKRETLIGKTLLEVLPDTEPVWIEKYGEVALTGQSIHFDQYHAGLSRHYEVFAYCPAPRLFAVLFLDITERKRVEDLLAENENRLERAQEIAHLGSWELDVINNPAYSGLMRSTGFSDYNPRNSVPPMKPSLRQCIPMIERRWTPPIPDPCEREKIATRSSTGLFENLPEKYALSMKNVSISGTKPAKLSGLSAWSRISPSAKNWRRKYAGRGTSWKSGFENEPPSWP